MDECVDALPPKPQIEGDIRMTGGARKIVILGIAMIEVTAFRLDRDDDFATSDRGKTELAGSTTGIIFRRAPGVCEIILQLTREPRQLLAVIVEVPPQFLAQEHLTKRFDEFDVKAGGIEIG
jgi:hypothetical protein